MRVLLMLVCGVLAGATAKPSLYHGYVPATYSTYYPYSLSSQYHAQDELGQYSYGYSGDTSAKHETKTLDGVTRGGYSYLDANGIVQTVNYVSDPVHGFRVAATNLPQDPAPVVAAAAAAPLVVPQSAVVVDTPAVAAAKASHLATVKAAAAQAAAAQAAALAQVATVQTVTATPVVVSQPAVVVDTPAVAAAKASHLAAVQAAAIQAAAAQAAAAAPLPVTETPEVQRAKAEHLAAVYKAAAAAAAAPDYSEVVAAAPLAPVVSTAPLTSTYYSAPLVSGYGTSYGAGYPLVSGYGYGAGYPLATAGYSYVPVAHTSYSALTPLSSQYHAQDELGQYSYGYAGGPSAKHETKTLDGVTRGSYSYVDANGIVQTVNYVADDVFGFRVAATNLPVAPVAH